MAKYITTILILLSISTFSFPQENPWSLEDCINYAMENNITIKQTELNTQYNENILNQSKKERLPNLNATSNYRHSFGRAIDYSTNTYTDDQQDLISVGLNSDITLFNGFQQKNTIEKNSFNLLASSENTEKIKNDIALNIAAGYLQILFNQELLEVAKNQLEVTSQQVERTGKMVEAGKVARGSALEIQAQYAAEELNVINADNQLTMAYLNLQQMLDLPYDPNFKIISPDLETPEDAMILGNVNEIYSTAEQNMPQVKNSEYLLEAAKKDLDIAKGAFYPSLGFNANTGTGYANTTLDLTTLDPTDIASFEDQLSNNYNLVLALGLQIPIFNRHQIKTNISNAKINIENSELELQSTKNALYRSIQQSHVDALGALKKYNSTEKALISMEESFKYTEKKFEVGLVNTVDYNTSKNQLTKTQSDLLQAKYDFIFKTKILNFYKGEKITL